MLRTNCAHCNKRVKFDERLHGQQANCPRCSSLVLLVPFSAASRTEMSRQRPPAENSAATPARPDAPQTRLLPRLGGGAIRLVQWVLEGGVRRIAGVGVAMACSYFLFGYLSHQVVAFAQTQRFPSNSFLEPAISLVELFEPKEKSVAEVEAGEGGSDGPRSGQTNAGPTSSGGQEGSSNNGNSPNTQRESGSPVRGDESNGDAARAQTLADWDDLLETETQAVQNQGVSKRVGPQVVALTAKGDSAWTEFAAKDVASFYVSPNRKLLTIGGFNGSFTVYRIEDAAPLLQFRVPDGGAVKSIRFSPDGKLAACRFDNEPFVRLWNLATRSYVQKFTTSKREAVFDFSPDSRFLGVANGALVTIYGTETANVDRQLRLPPAQPLSATGSESCHITSLAFSATAKRLMWGQSDGATRFWDLRDGTLTETRCWHNDAVQRVMYSLSDPDQAFSLDASGGVKAWSLTTFESRDATAKEKLRFAAIHHGNGVAIMPERNGTRIFWNGLSYQLKSSVCNFSLGKAFLDFEGRNLIAYDDRNDVVRRLDLSVFLNSIQREFQITLKGKRFQPVGMEFFSQSPWLVVGQANGTIGVFNVETQQMKGMTVRGPLVAMDVASQRHSLIAATGENLYVCQDWSSNPKFERAPYDVAAKVRGVGLDSLGEKFMVVTNDSSTGVYRTANGEAVGPGWRDTSYRVVAGPKLKHIAAKKNSSTWQLLRTGSSDARKLALSSSIQDAAFSTSGERLFWVTSPGYRRASSLGSIDLQSGMRRLDTFPVDINGRIQPLMFALSRNGKFIAVASKGANNCELQVRERASLKLLHRFVGHRGDAYGIAVSDTHLALLTSFYDTSVSATCYQLSVYRLPSDVSEDSRPKPAGEEGVVQTDKPLKAEGVEQATGLAEN